jgi:hypothetical protein
VRGRGRGGGRKREKGERGEGGKRDKGEGERRGGEKREGSHIHKQSPNHQQGLIKDNQSADIHGITSQATAQQTHQTGKRRNPQKNADI